MEIKELFNNMIADPNIEVQEFAKKTQEIKQYWIDKKISQEEYDELVNDLLELKSVNKQMLSLDVQKKLQEFTDILKNIKFFTSII